MSYDRFPTALAEGSKAECFRLYFFAPTSTTSTWGSTSPDEGAILFTGAMTRMQRVVHDSSRKAPRGKIAPEDITATALVANHPY